MTTAANTPTHYYLDTKDVKKDCENDFKKIDKECGPKETREKEQHPVLNKLLGKTNTQKLEAMAAKVKGEIPTTNDNRWMSHCDGLWVKPASLTDEMKEFNQMFESMSKDLGESLKNVINPMLNELGNLAKTEAENFAKSQAEKAALREVAIIVAGGGPEDLIADGIAIVDRVVTVARVAMYSPAILDKLNDLKSFKDMATKAMSEMSDLAGNVKNMTPTQLMAGGMGVLGRLNPCIRARRCLLVPYDKTGTADSLGGHGCCPGQTGHHILPDAMTRDGNCPGYTKDGAPTLCVEGTNNAMGTHGQIHDVLAILLNQHKTSLLGGPTISYKKARNEGILSVETTFPESRCNPECLKAQLDAYYKTKCTKDMPANPGKKSSAESGGNVK